MQTAERLHPNNNNDYYHYVKEVNSLVLVFNKNDHEVKSASDHE